MEDETGHYRTGEIKDSISNRETGNFGQRKRGGFSQRNKT